MQTRTSLVDTPLATSIRETIRSTPVVGELAYNTARRYRDSRFLGSARFWERHYAAGRNSGTGSMGHLADFKATVIADLCEQWGVESVIEWGCGDGNQLSRMALPRYIGCRCQPHRGHVVHHPFCRRPGKELLLV